MVVQKAEQPLLPKVRMDIHAAEQHNLWYDALLATAAVFGARHRWIAHLWIHHICEFLLQHETREMKP